VELLIEFLETLEFSLQFRFGEDEGCDTEVIGSRVLSESASRDENNSGVFQDFEAIEEINILLVLCSCGDSFIGEFD